jgi:cytoskeletal protein CcmA (bactofilin family)
MKAKAPSILSADLKITGSIVSDGEVQLDGSVEGDVRATDLTIGEEASIKGEVVAENVVIRGRVVGSVRARQVQLSATARVEGDVIHATLAIESGAFFDGLCKRSSDPLSDAKSSLGQRRLHELVQIAVQHPLRVGAFMAGAQVLDQLVGLQNVGADLVAPADIGLGFRLRRWPLPRAFEAPARTDGRAACPGGGRFLCCERSFWHCTTMPVGSWVMRTAESVVLTCWPPAPDAR